MSRRERHATRHLALIAALAALTLPASASARYTMTPYNIKVAVKGATTLANTGSAGSDDELQESSTAMLRFTMLTVTQELLTRPPEACPGESAAEALSSIDPSVYRAEFSVPVSSMGHKTIAVRIAGPPAQYRPLLACGSGCKLDMAWRGSVRFTRGAVVTASSR